MILAVSELQQTLFSHRPIATGCRAVHAYPLGRQIVDSQQIPIESTLKCTPALIITQCLQYISQAIVGKVQFGRHVPAATLQRLQSPPGPSSDVGQAMIRFRHNVTQPHNRQPSQAQSTAIPMARKVPIQQVGHTHAHLMGDQYRNIVYSFTFYSQLIGHTDKLITISDSRPEMSEW